MANHGDIDERTNKTGAQEKMMQQLSADTSRAFLDDVRSELTPAKVAAQADWWKSLGKENQAPAKINSPEDLKALEEKGWKIDNDIYSTKISHLSPDGRKKETDTYAHDSGFRIESTFSEAKNEKDLSDNSKIDRQVDIRYYEDGKSPFSVYVDAAGPDRNYGYFRNENEFQARFSPDGKLTTALQFGHNSDFVNYRFNDNGGLYEARRTGIRDGHVVNDFLFNSKGEQLSNFDPRYLYEKIRRPIENYYLGWRETRRAAIF